MSVTINSFLKKLLNIVLFHTVPCDTAPLLFSLTYKITQDVDLGLLDSVSNCF